MDTLICGNGKKIYNFCLFHQIHPAHHSNEVYLFINFKNKMLNKKYFDK